MEKQEVRKRREQGKNKNQANQWQTLKKKNSEFIKKITLPFAKFQKFKKGRRRDGAEGRRTKKQERRREKLPTAKDFSHSEMGRSKEGEPTENRPGSGAVAGSGTGARGGPVSPKTMLATPSHIRLTTFSTFPELIFARMTPAALSTQAKRQTE